MKQKIFIQQKENEVLALNQTLYLWMFELEDGETGCEFAVFLPQGYDYNLKKMV